jgi:proteasome lid subunit RPN8/RPN11
MSLLPATIEAMRAHALAAYPNEACGLVAVIKGREQYVPCRNEADSPTQGFVMPGEDYIAVEEAGEITACVHSHPDDSAKASDADRVRCEASGLPWYIVAVHRDPADGSTAVAGINSIVPEGYEAPLVGRNFHHGVLDCYTLIRDWYKRERGIELPDFKRPDDWWNDGHSSLYMDHFAEAGFEPYPKDTPLEIGDVILMQIRSGNDVPNHAGVYVGDGKMLHHLLGRLSSRDVYGGQFAEATRIIVRRKPS